MTMNNDFAKLILGIFVDFVWRIGLWQTFYDSSLTKTIAYFYDKEKETEMMKRSCLNILPPWWPRIRFYISTK